jgi:hypothetical protein
MVVGAPWRFGGESNKSISGGPDRKVIFYQYFSTAPGPSMKLGAEGPQDLKVAKKTKPPFQTTLLFRFLLNL